VVSRIVYIVSSSNRPFGDSSFPVSENAKDAELYFSPPTLRPALRNISRKRTASLSGLIIDDHDMPEENWAAHGGVQAVSVPGSVDHERGLKDNSAIRVTLERYGY
jgi:hypothetical protein